MSFPRHEEIYRSDAALNTVEGWGRRAASRWSAPEPSRKARRKERARLIVRDEFPVGYSLAGCSPAEPASASPTVSSMRWRLGAGNCLSANGNLSLISVSQRRGSLQSVTAFDLSPFCPCVDLAFHDLRRTFKTGLAELGVTGEIRDALMNHSRPGMDSVYNHAGYVVQKRAAMLLWACDIQLKVVAGLCTEARPSDRKALYLA